MLRGVYPECNEWAQHLVAQRDRPFAEFTLSETNVLRVKVEGPIPSFVVFFETAFIVHTADESAFDEYSAINPSEA